MSQAGELQPRLPVPSLKTPGLPPLLLLGDTLPFPPSPLHCVALLQLPDPVHIKCPTPAAGGRCGARLLIVPSRPPGPTLSPDRPAPDNGS